MKKTLLFFALLTSISTFAQNNLNVKFGLNITDQIIKLDGDRTNDDNEYKHNIGYYLGLGYDIFIVNEHLSVEPAIVIQARGFKYKEKVSGDKVSDKNVLHYLDIPIMVKGGFVTDGGVRIYIAAGPSFGIALTGKNRDKQKIDGHRSGGFSQLELGNDDTDAYKRFDIAINISPGVEIKKFGVNYVFGQGLLNIIPSANDDFKGKNRTHSITAYYKFLEK